MLKPVILSGACHEQRSYATSHVIFSHMNSTQNITAWQHYLFMFGEMLYNENGS